MSCSKLLSQLLVAFTIEFDNEFEHRMPHRTTNYGGHPDGPWLVSMVMWFNCMRFVSEAPIGVSELERLARTPTNLDGMRRWRYIDIEPSAESIRRKTRQTEWQVRATSKGSAAREVWSGLFDIIEDRWNKRFGSGAMRHLRELLANIVSKLGSQLPDCLPILGYGLWCRTPEQADSSKTEGSNTDTLPLAALIARVLLAFAIDFERESALSLAISANVLRVLKQDGVRMRDLPAFSGVSKEAVSMALGVLEKRRFAVFESGIAGTRAKQVQLTSKGFEAQGAYRKLLTDTEQRWEVLFGKTTIENLRQVLARVAGEEEDRPSRLFDGLEPYNEGWRARVRKPEVLPHFPMVLHRGGFPDGS